MSRSTAKRGSSVRVDAGRTRPKYFGFAEAKPELYEFHTIGGEYVFVHDMECIGIDYRPLTRQLVLTFESSGSEVMNDLKLELTFGGAEIYQWESTDQEDGSEPGQESRLRGQVSHLLLIARGSFSIVLFELVISFHATSVTCAVTPRE